MSQICKRKRKLEEKKRTKNRQHPHHGCYFFFCVLNVSHGKLMKKQTRRWWENPPNPPPHYFLPLWSFCWCRRRYIHSSFDHQQFASCWWFYWCCFHCCYCYYFLYQEGRDNWFHDFHRETFEDILHQEIVHRYSRWYDYYHRWCGYIHSGFFYGCYDPNVAPFLCHRVIRSVLLATRPFTLSHFILLLYEQSCVRAAVATTKTLLLLLQLTSCA